MGEAVVVMVVVVEVVAVVVGEWNEMLLSQLTAS